jgi:ABC-type Mn2+/Zn2+ transport system permease subunit
MSSGFLSSGEEWLFREVELLHKLHAEIRDTHLKYQSWFMLVQSVLLAAIINLLVAKSFLSREPLFYLVCAVALTLGLCAWVLQLRHMLDGDTRIRRIRELSVALRRPITTNSGANVQFMAFIAGEVLGARRWNRFSYGRIRLLVDAIFPILWALLLALGPG